MSLDTLIAFTEELPERRIRKTQTRRLASCLGLEHAVVALVVAGAWNIGTGRLSRFELMERGATAGARKD